MRDNALVDAEGQYLVSGRTLGSLEHPREGGRMTQWAQGPKRDNVSSNWCFVFSHARKLRSLDGAHQPFWSTAVLRVLPRAIDHVVAALVSRSNERQVAHGTLHLACSLVNGTHLEPAAG